MRYYRQRRINLANLSESLPEGFEGAESLSGKFDSVEQLAKSYQELERTMGSKVTLPSDTASAEDLDGFYQKLGKPDSAEGYTAPEGMEEWSESARAIALASHMTRDQWNLFAKAQEEAMRGATKQAEQNLEEGHTRLQEKYGSSYEGHLETAKRGRDYLMQNEQLSETVGGLDLKDPAAYELLKTVGGLMADDQTPNTSETAQDESSEHKKMAARLKEIMLSPSWGNRKDPEHEKVSQEYYSLFAQLTEAGYSGATDPRLQSGFRLP